MKILDHLKVIKLLVLKNWRVRLHHKISFGLLFLIPICFTASMILATKSKNGLAYTRTNRTESTVTRNEIYYNSSNVFENITGFESNSFRWGNSFSSNWPPVSVNIVYCPNNSFTDRLAQRVGQLMNKKFKNRFVFNVFEVNFEEQLIDIWKKDPHLEQYGIVFDLKDNQKQLFYKLSVSDKDLRNYEYYRNINRNIEYYGGTNQYLYYGFSAMQLAIDLSYISLITNTSIDDQIEVSEQRMPIPPITKVDQLKERLNYEAMFITVLVILFGLLVMLPVTVKRIVEERQTTITDYLFLLGVGRIDHWISAIVDTFSVIALQHLIITLLLLIENKELREYSMTNQLEAIHSHSLLFGLDLSLFLFFSFLFLIQSILFVCLISVFFKSPNIAVIATILIWILSFSISIIYLFGVRGRGGPALEHFGLEVISCLLPNCALFWFIYISIGMEINLDSGAKWKNIFSPGYLIDEMTLAHIMLTIIISYIIYSILIWYLSSVIPFKDSKVRPFYFPLKSIYEIVIKKFKNQSENYESMFDNENHAIYVKNLSKSYKSLFGFRKDKILKNIELEVNKNSITVLLGQNGSGKTTLINIITGLIETKGNVFINGYHIRKEQQMARNVTGICPQQNVFFKFLTLREHLVFFNELKRVLRKRTDGYNGQQLIEALDLKSDIDKEAITLSGGTLRRMVLAMALIGPNDVLLLDEPTAALDPKVRQQVWDLIIDSRKTKSILITSHHLEEANLLSDQIIIIGNGKICFNGSTLQMKREFDSGYHLKILKSSQMQTETKIKETVSKFVQIKKFKKSDQGENEELVFEIDFEENPKLSAMFDKLQNNQSLAINNLSLGMTTLEDSYAKIVRNSSNDLDILKPNVNNDNCDENLINDSNYLNKSEENEWKLILRQFRGILIKRLHYVSKHFTLVLTLLIIPVVFLMLFFISIESMEIASTLYKKPILLKSQKVYGNGIKGFVVSDNNSFGNIYSNILNDNQITKIDLKNKSDIEKSLISYAENNFLQYFQKLLYGMSTNNTNNRTRIKVWHNSNAYHSLPISLNLMTNALLKQMTDDMDYGIKVSNSPLPIFWNKDPTINTRQELYSNDGTFAFQILALMFGLSFTSASYVLMPITERRTKFKLLQLMSGLKPLVYWSANFLFDFTLHAICSIVYTSVYHIFDTKEYFIGSEKSFISIYLMFLLYGFAFIPFAYLVSLIFEKPSSGFTFISLYNLIFTQIVITIMTILQFGIRLCDNDCFGYKLLRELLVFINPFVVFLNEMTSLHQILSHNNFCQTFNPNQFENFCSDKELERRNYNRNYLCCFDPCNHTFVSYSSLKPRHVFYSIDYDMNTGYDKKCYHKIDPIGYINQYLYLFVVYGFIYFAIILIMEMKLYQRLVKMIITKMRAKKTEILELQDLETTEVKKESENVTQIVTNQSFDGFSLVVDKLTKKFNKSLTVPDNISFLVNKEECFGLLGTNGSGKTTIFRLLTGDLNISSGNAYLGLNADLIQNKRNFYSRIGYCPQNDALLDRLTGMQTLLFFGRIRGLDSNAINKFIENVIDKFELKNIIDKRLSTYSGGNRRKISLAIALMGTTQLLLLDEPTTGVDPESRIKIWQLLRDLMSESKMSILLTSHNMSECEVLCSRLAIVSDGRLKTIGFINDLKRTFAKGFVIILKLKPDSSADTLKTQIVVYFGSNCLLKYENFGVIHYNLVSDDIQLSQIFHSLELIKNEFDLEDYFVSNATLEQVFHSIIESNNLSEA